MEANANLEGLKETAQNAVDKLQSNELVYVLVLILIMAVLLRLLNLAGKSFRKKEKILQRFLFLRERI